MRVHLNWELVVSLSERRQQGWANRWSHLLRPLLGLGGETQSSGTDVS